MIIGLVGRSRAGKDSVGTILKESYGFETLAFAGTFKQILKEVFCLNEEQLYGELKGVPDFRYGGMTPRLLMQLTGTSAGRNGDFSWALKHETKLREAFLRRYLVPKPTIWVDDLMNRLQDYDKVVITDVRHLNEASALISCGAKLVKIVRPGVEELNHSSEQEVDKILVDTTIINDTSIEDLKTKVTNLSF